VACSGFCRGSASSFCVSDACLGTQALRASPRLGFLPLQSARPAPNLTLRRRAVELGQGAVDGGQFPQAAGAAAPPSRGSAVSVSRLSRQRPRPKRRSASGTAMQRFGRYRRRSGHCAGNVNVFAVGTRVTSRPPQSGRIEARIGLRMMPTFPRSPLSFAE